MTLGRVLMIAGAALFVVGLLLSLAPRVPWLGRLPGDIHIARGNWSFHFPIATSLLLSVLLTLIFYLIGRR